MFDSLQPHGLTHQVPLSMEFFRQEYRNGLPFPIPWDLPDPGIEHMSSGVSYISCIGRQILYHWAKWEALETEKFQVMTQSSGDCR